MNTVLRIGSWYIVTDGADRTVGSFRSLWETLLEFPDARLKLPDGEDTIFTSDPVSEEEPFDVECITS